MYLRTSTFYHVNKKRMQWKKNQFAGKTTVYLATWKRKRVPSGSRDTCAFKGIRNIFAGKKKQFISPLGSASAFHVTRVDTCALNENYIFVGK